MAQARPFQQPILLPIEWLARWFEHLPAQLGQRLSDYIYLEPQAIVQFLQLCLQRYKG